MHESVVLGTTFEHIKPVERASFWSRARGRNAFALGSEVNIRETGQGWQGCMISQCIEFEMWTKDSVRRWRCSEEYFSFISCCSLEPLSVLFRRRLEADYT
ncbi:putative D-xylulose reductase A [Fusarium oxysporum f. sp. albedinis]|nr:putative D-xylulose reductase A [Fusarium oxysporum f. sp. albedinis]